MPLLTLSPIGVIRSEHRNAEETPIHPVLAADCKGRVEVYPEFAEGLKDIELYSHIYLLFHMHQAGGVRLRTKPDCSGASGDGSRRSIASRRSSSR